MIAASAEAVWVLLALLPTAAAVVPAWRGSPRRLPIVVTTARRPARRPRT